MKKYRILLEERREHEFNDTPNDIVKIELFCEIDGQIYRALKNYTLNEEKLNKDNNFKKRLIGKCFAEIGEFLQKI